MNTVTEVLDPVESRISWGSIIAGAIVSVGAFSLLTSLGAAIGFSLNESMTTGQIELLALFFVVLATLVSLFAGGWVTGQSVSGESQREAVFSGAILWCLLSSIVFLFAMNGISSNLNMALSAGLGTERYSASELERLGNEAGLSPEQISRLAEEGVRDAMTTATTPRVMWTAFGGMLLSLVAAVLGALVGTRSDLLIRGPVVRTSGHASHAV